MAVLALYRFRSPGRFFVTQACVNMWYFPPIDGFAVGSAYEGVGADSVVAVTFVFRNASQWLIERSPVTGHKRGFAVAGSMDKSTAVVGNLDGTDPSGVDIFACTSGELTFGHGRLGFDGCKQTARCLIHRVRFTSGSVVAASTAGGDILNVTVLVETDTDDLDGSSLAELLQRLQASAGISLNAGSYDLDCPVSNVSLQAFITESNVTYAQTAVLCTLPAGAGTDRAISVRFNSAACSNPTSVSASYPPPEIDTTRIAVVSGSATTDPPPNSNTVRARAAGRIRIRVPARNLGTDQSLIRVTYGDASSPAKFTCRVVHMNDTSLTCTTEGNEIDIDDEEQALSAETTMRFSVTLLGANVPAADGGDIQLIPFAFLPTITSVQGCNVSVSANRTSGCPLDGGTFLTMGGSNFGVNGTTSVLIGSSACRNVTVVSETQLTCVLPEGIGSPAVVAVTVTTCPQVRQRFGPQVQLLSYEALDLESIDCGVLEVQCTSDVLRCDTTCPRKSGVLTFRARGLGSVAGLAVQVGGRVCLALPSPDRNTLMCSVPAGLGESLSVSVRDQSGSLMVREATVSYEKCPAGHIVNSTTFDCSLCPAGSYTASLDALACQACPAGSFSNESSTTCTLCEPGSYSPERNSPRCTRCSPGRFQDNAGQSSCSECLPGSYSDSANAIVCTSCPSGRYSTGGGTPCELCPTGSIASATRAECIKCNPGQVVVQGVCIDCPAGRYSNSSAGVCELCEPGTFASTNGSAWCRPCGRGEYQSDAGHAECSKCPRNTESRGGAHECVLCPPYEYTDGPGADECDSCTSGKYVRFRSRAYGPGHPDREKLTCLACPDGATCSSGLARADEGAWIAVSDSGRAESWTCLPGRCTGCPDSATLFAGTNSSAMSCCSSKRVVADRNPMCAQCIEDYVEWGGECVECTGTNGGLLFGLLFAFFCVVVFMHFALNQASNALAPIFMYYVQTVLISFGEETEFLAWTSFFNLNPLQTASGPTCVAPWSPVDKMMVSALTPLLSWAFLVVVFVGELGWIKIREYNGGKPSHVTVGQLAVPYLRSCVSFFFFSFNAMASTSIRFFACVEVAGGRWRVVESSPDIDCDSQVYKDAQGLFIALLIIVVVSPFLLFALLHQPKLRDLAGHDIVIRHTTSDEDAAPSKAAHRRVASRVGVDSSAEKKRLIKVYGLLFEMYNGHKRAVAHYWRVVLLFRRIVVVSAIAVTQGHGRPTQYAVLTMAHVCILVSHMKFKPYRDMSVQGEFIVGQQHRRELREEGVSVLRVNALETISLFMITLSTAAVAGAQVPLSDGAQAGFGVVIFGWMVYLLGLIIWRMRERHLWKKEMQTLEEAGARRQSTVVGLHESASSGLPGEARDSRASVSYSRNYSDGVELQDVPRTVHREENESRGVPPPLPPRGPHLSPVLTSKSVQEGDVLTQWG